MDVSQYYLIAAIILSLLMTWGVGANDLANVMSTTMGSKAVTVKQAMLIAIAFEFLGAFLGGSGVTETMRDGIINTTSLTSQPKILIEGMLAVLLAGTLWMNLASYFALPVSITNALVGSMVGFGSIVLGVNAVEWAKVYSIAISWITSPMLAGIVAYALVISIQVFIFSRRDPLAQAQKLIPYYLLLVGGILSFITVFKGLNHFNIQLNLKQDIAITLFSSIAITFVGMICISRIPKPQQLRRRDRFLQAEKYFAVLMAMTACAMVFAHGSNDIALAVAPLTVIHSLLTQKEAFDVDNYPAWMLILGSGGACIGLLMYGKKVIETVGSAITALTPSRAFAATFAAATTVVIATSTGIPVSATQTLVGAVLGVGLARGIGALNLRVIRNIFMSWIITLPAASMLTIGSFYLLNKLL